MNRELIRLATLLRQIAHDAGLALLRPGDPGVARHSAACYNRVRAHLAARLPDDAVFPVLPDAATPGDVRMAAHALALYLDGLRREHFRERLTAWFDAFCPLRVFTLHPS